MRDRQRFKFLILAVPICAVIIFIFSACKERENQKKINDINAVIDQIVPEAERSLEEIKKLRQIEYRVFSMADTATASEMAGELNKLGGTGWDCFHVEKRTGEGDGFILTFFCKKPVDTPLSYIPKGIFGGG